MLRLWIALLCLTMLWIAERGRQLNNTINPIYLEQPIYNKDSCNVEVKYEMVFELYDPNSLLFRINSM